MATIVEEFTAQGSGTFTINALITGNLKLEVICNGGYITDYESGYPYGTGGAGGGAYGKGDFTISGNTVMEYNIPDGFLSQNLFVQDDATNGTVAQILGGSGEIGGTGLPYGAGTGGAGAGMTISGSGFSASSDVRRNGGNGFYDAGADGGGGGGSAGPAANGNNAASSTGATAVTGGGPGGNGAPSGDTGSTPSGNGGGAGGSGAGDASGVVAGAVALIRATYDIPDAGSFQPANLLGGLQTSTLSGGIYQ